MTGIVFYGTRQHDAVVDFYVDTVGAEIRLEQPDCTILRYDNMLFAFCDRDRTDDEGIITFVSETRAGVDAAHERVGDAARGPPVENERYGIYQFFADDPDGRTVEFQAFLGDVDL
jgi:hypothetical protein